LPSWAASSTAPAKVREADLGVASSNGKGQIVKGQIVATVPRGKIVDTLIRCPVEFSNVRIPANTEVLSSLTALHRPRGLP
jgi:hypothetical protein